MLSPIVVSGYATLSENDTVHGLKCQLSGTSKVDLKRHIAKRGIRFKDRATQIGLAVTKLAMQQAGWIEEAYCDLENPRLAVIAASSYGNLDTVLGATLEQRDKGVAALSPMALPNASANVLASTLALWFGARGPNLFIDNGVSSGLDALMFARNLIATDRIDAAIICCAESTQPCIEQLFIQDDLMNDLPVDIGSSFIVESRKSYIKRTGNSEVAAWQLDFDHYVCEQDSFPEVIVDSETQQYELLKHNPSFRNFLRRTHSAASLLSLAYAFQQTESTSLKQLLIKNGGTELKLSRERF